MLSCRLGAQKDTRQIYVHYVPPLGGRQFERRLNHADAGIVHQNVDPSKATYGLSESGFYRRFVGGLATSGSDFDAGIRGFQVFAYPRQPFGIYVEQSQVGSIRGKSFGEREAEAARAARDEH